MFEDGYISTRQYFTLITGKDTEEAIIMAKKDQLLDSFDIINLDKPITRRRAASIAHSYLHNWLDIPDLSHIYEAEMLRDLYDCRVCANAIAHVFLRNIMGGFWYNDEGERQYSFYEDIKNEPHGILLFLKDEYLECAQAKQIARKLQTIER